jgi:hypothetical protein
LPLDATGGTTPSRPGSGRAPCATAVDNDDNDDGAVVVLAAGADTTTTDAEVDFDTPPEAVSGTDFDSRPLPWMGVVDMGRVGPPTSLLTTSLGATGIEIGSRIAEAIVVGGDADDRGPVPESDKRSADRLRFLPPECDSRGATGAGDGAGVDANHADDTTVVRVGSRSPDTVMCFPSSSPAPDGTGLATGRGPNSTTVTAVGLVVGEEGGGRSDGDGDGNGREVDIGRADEDDMSREAWSGKDEDEETSRSREVRGRLSGAASPVLPVSRK